MEINEKASWPAASQSASSWEYDVFISFRGEDTRKNFTDHLYMSLVGKGIRTFRDDDRLEKGKDIQENLYKAIEKSRFSIIVFSKDYASSKWCLDELAKIMECPSTTPLPVFYGVEAGEVRNQTGSFQASFSGYETNPKTSHKVMEWRNAMKKAATAAGWDVGNRHETEVIGEIIRFLFVKLNASVSSFNDSMKLVGISSRVKEVIKYLRSEDLCYLGICGMSGIGKTTLANVVYAEACNWFDATAFLSDIKDESEKNGIVYLQTKLLSKLLNEEQVSLETEQQGVDLIQKRLRRMRVLIVLDDVSKLEQLQKLVGRPDWFGPGSKIIITTKNKHVLKAHSVNKTYVVNALNDKDALRLFSQITFGSASPPQRFVEHSKRLVRYANGHPLALKVLGSSLIGRDDIRLWNSKLDMLSVIPDEEITNKLRISFDELNKTEKEVFLHIVCFFNGWEKDRVEYILSCCGEFNPIFIMEILRERYLVDVSNSRLHVHDLIQQMGQNIVHNECPSDPGGRSRLWCLEGVSQVFRDDSATEAVQGIVLNFLLNINQQWKAKTFQKMKNLRFLILNGNPFFGDFNFLCNELRYMEWRNFPYNTLPASFKPGRLVELNMRRSNIKELWKGVKGLPCLKTIDLSFSKELIKIPNLSGVPNLEKLILICCDKLSSIDESIGSLEKLALLNLRHCKALKTLPKSISKLKRSLQILNISGCRSLYTLPENLHIESLEKFESGGSGIQLKRQHGQRCCLTIWVACGERGNEASESPRNYGQKEEELGTMDAPYPYAIETKRYFV